MQTGKEAYLKKNQNLAGKIHHEVGKKILVKGEACVDKVVWLNRSLVGESIQPLDFVILKEKLFKECLHLAEVRAMSSYKCLLMNESSEDVEAALSDGRDLLMNHFKDVRCRTEQEVCRTK